MVHHQSIQKELFQLGLALIILLMEILFQFKTNALFQAHQKCFLSVLKAKIIHFLQKIIANNLLLNLHFLINRFSSISSVLNFFEFIKSDPLVQLYFKKFLNFKKL